MQTTTKSRKGLETIKPTKFVPKPLERFTSVVNTAGSLLLTDFSNHIPTTKILDLVTQELDVHKNIVVTPQMAMDLLTLNTSNRPIRTALVSRYVRDMISGDWLFAGNAIKFDWDRVLRDGQHSLLAVIKSGKEQQFNIQTGLDPKTFAVMDTGQVRTGGDVVAIEGFPNHSFSVASAIKSVLYFETLSRLKTNIRYSTVTNHAIRDWTEKKHDMKIMEEGLGFITEFKTNGKGGYMHISTWLFLWYILSRLNMMQAKEFLSKLASGEDISMKNNPEIYLLREKLISFGESHLKELKKGGVHITEIKIRYVFRAWNAWRKGEKITKLSIDTSDPKIEKPV